MNSEAETWPMTVVPTTVSPGGVVRVSMPPGAPYGQGWELLEETGEGWQPRYVLIGGREGASFDLHDDPDGPFIQAVQYMSKAPVEIEVRIPASVQPGNRYQLRTSSAPVGVVTVSVLDGPSPTRA